LTGELTLVVLYAQFLILRGWIRKCETMSTTERGSGDWAFGISFEAMGDANKAEGIALQHELLWLQRDVHLLLADLADADGEAHDAGEHRHAAQRLTDTLLPNH
jgi:hypothetical protein